MTWGRQVGQIFSFPGSWLMASCFKMAFNFYFHVLSVMHIQPCTLYLHLHPIQNPLQVSGYSSYTIGQCVQIKIRKHACNIFHRRGIYIYWHAKETSNCYYFIQIYGLIFTTARKRHTSVILDNTANLAINI